MTRQRQPELLAPILAEATGQTAKLMMYGRIDPDGAPWGISATEFGDVLANLPDDVDTIDLHIHSRGGDVFDALAIAQQLHDHPAAVHATVDGIAASAASFIATSCDTVTMTPDSSLMIHDARALVIDVMTASETQKLQTRLTHANDKIAAMYARKAGGTAEDWAAAMDAESWYSADEAVAAGLADTKVTGRPGQPAAVAASLDLSIFAHAGRDHAPAPFIPAAAAATQTPAEPPVTPSTEPKEADTMSDTLLNALRKQHGLADDADEATVLAANLEALNEAADPPATPPALPAGHVAISADALDELRIAARAGQEARAVQLRAERDDTIAAAVRDGKIAPARRDHWAANWDKDPEGTKASIDSLEAVYPVAAAPAGYAGEPGVTDEDAFYTSLFGTDEKASA